jgi:hypothetical protein
MEDKSMSDQPPLITPGTFAPACVVLIAIVGVCVIKAVGL